MVQGLVSIDSGRRARRRHPARFLACLVVLGMTVFAGGRAAVAGGAGQPVRAANFGASGWQALSGGASLFDGVYCPSIYGCSFAGTAPGPTGVIWANNGQAGDGSPSNYVKQLSVANSFFDDLTCAGGGTDCVAVGGKLGSNPAPGLVYYTPDGLIWHAATLPAGTTELGWVKCVPNGPYNANTPSGYCWATGVNGGAWQSTDGGQSWSVLPITPKTPDGLTIYYAGVSLESTTTGWVVGNACASGHPCRGVVASTSNGGTSWSLQNTPSGTAALNDITCPSSTECVIVGTHLAGQQKSVAYITTNGGSTWSATALPFGMRFANAVACPDTRTCYVVGGSGPYKHPGGTVVFATTNGGRTWNVEPVDNGTVGLYEISCPTDNDCYAAGSMPGAGAVAVTTNGGVPVQGYRIADAGAQVASHTDWQSTVEHIHPAKPIVAIVNDNFTAGYWLMASDGGVFSNNAPFYGSAGAIHLNKPIVGAVATYDGGGYYMVASDGGIFPYGDAYFQGSTGAMTLTKPVVGMALNRQTGGYWLVASDGGIFSYNTPFYGSTGAMRLNKPIVGMAVDPVTGGYWLVASDGGVFSFNATFYGSTGNLRLTSPIVSIQATPDGRGYWMTAADGGVFSFGDAHFLGSGVGAGLTSPVVGMSTTSS